MNIYDVLAVLGAVALGIAFAYLVLKTQRIITEH